MAKYLAQVIVLGAQVIGRAFARALQQEYQASRMAAQSGQSGGGNGAKASRSQGVANAKMGITIQEALEILNIKPNNGIDADKVQKSYSHLFEVNEKSKGGSFYIQSKGNPWCSYPGKMYTSQRHLHIQTPFDNIFTPESKAQLTTRLEAMDSFVYKSKTFVKAAVLVPLCHVRGVPSVLFTLRSSKVSRNKNDVSFPGGMMEKQDSDLVSAALRETEEEISIPPSSVDVWAVMKPLTAVKGGSILVTPIVAYIGDIEPENCKLNYDEVQLVFSQTLESLCNPQHWRYTYYKTRVPFKTPAFVGSDYRIWGLTAYVLHCVLSALLPTHYSQEGMGPIKQSLS